MLCKHSLINKNWHNNCIVIAVLKTVVVLVEGHYTSLALIEPIRTSGENKIVYIPMTDLTVQSRFLFLWMIDAGGEATETGCQIFNCWKAKVKVVRM